MTSMSSIPAKLNWKYKANSSRNAYYRADIKSILEQLAPHLLTVACYDREVNCRKAATAAFQENVGRQGNYPHGINIVNTTDYFALSSRTNSYLQIAVYIAQYDGYLYLFVDELLNSKICHWDGSLRKLAADTLSSLAKYDPGYFASTIVGKLLPCTLSSDLCMRQDLQNQVAGVVPELRKHDKIKRSLLDTLHDNLRHPNSQIQGAAVAALKSFIPAYLVVSESKSFNAITSKIR
ncbi:hypothetical protein HAX54_031664 [Datura stramonium]|uniref:Tubulin-folding cofactor D ARM repeats domain-containing protein n=1 Tax=Datura stramonium TaxID=4076 RepID=A0ABS8VA80_DATST|nr:hypothetical protein [Datura stramonium]